MNKLLIQKMLHTPWENPNLLPLSEDIFCRALLKQIKLFESFNFKIAPAALFENIDVIKVLDVKNKGEYEIRTELWKSPGGPKDPPQEMISAYSTYDGSYMGSADPRQKNGLLKMVRRYNITQIQKSKPSHNVASIGFVENYKNRGPRWIGWSHRAACSFGIGDKLFKEREYNKMTDITPFIKGGTTTIRSLSQAKQAAKNFASYVS